jgi:hypothetical protein
MTKVVVQNGRRELTRGQMAKAVRNAGDKRPDGMEKASEARIKLSRSIIDYVNSCGSAWITSPPATRPMRLECLEGSDVPDELKKRGLTLVERGTETRIFGHMPVEAPGYRQRAKAQNPFVVVKLWEIDLPK